MFLLIAYDIANHKRLYRVARVMEDYGARVQRSVFECRIGEKELAAMLGRVKPILKKREDRIHIYHLCAACQQRFEQYGRGQLTTDAEVLIY
jgi:CRISPR-associated protein Cas2